jgi:chromosome segregation ATPase
MHPLMLKQLIATCHQRIMEGDHPTVPPFPTEQLEDAVAELDKKIVMLKQPTEKDVLQMLERAAARIAELERERDALAKDAERIRDWVCENEGDITGARYLDLVRMLNAAIDAAKEK